MSKNFYTNVRTYGNNILFRGIINGKRVKSKIEYKPSVYLHTNLESKYKTLHGQNLDKKTFESINDARDYINKFKDISNAQKIYGNTKWEYAFIADTQKGIIDWDIDQISIAVMDIEVGTEGGGFPDPYLANEIITAITISYIGGNTYVFGCGDYKTNGDEIYIKCDDEYTLCKKFLDVWTSKCPDIITGWNIKFFDIPYIINRFNKILGEPNTRKLSPWNNISKRQVSAMGKSKDAYEILGVSSLDYIELYRWYAPGGKSQESYRLDNIANVELGERKLSYEEYDNLHDLYKYNFQKYIEYNIVDVELIKKLDDKLKLLELSLTLAYDTKSNYEDVFAQTRMWDSLTNCYLLEKNIIVPPTEIKEKDSVFEGAYVKEPKAGKYDWVASFDLNSLYPHIIMQYNISPETIIEPEDYNQDILGVIQGGINVDSLLKKEVDTTKLNGVTLTPNGQFWRTDKQGFLPKMLEDMYEDRKKYKKLMIEAEKEYEKETDKEKLKEIDKRVARYRNIQLAKKLSLNSAYGALGSKFFRFYDLRMALAVTTAGQLSIRWIENKINVYMNGVLNTQCVDYVIASDTDSVVGSTIINVNGKDITIEEFYDSLSDDYIKYDSFNQDFVKKVTGYDTNSISNDFIIQEKPINYIMKHKVKKEMFKITNSHGKSVIVTSDHSLMVKHKKTGKLISISPSELNVKEHYLINVVN